MLLKLFQSIEKNRNFSLHFIRLEQPRYKRQYEEKKVQTNYTFEQIQKSKIKYEQRIIYNQINFIPGMLGEFKFRKSQNHNEIPLHSHQDGYNQKTEYKY